jgi:hypothetical protein
MKKTIPVPRRANSSVVTNNRVQQKRDISDIVNYAEDSHVTRLVEQKILSIPKRTNIQSIPIQQISQSQQSQYIQQPQSIQTSSQPLQQPQSSQQQSQQSQPSQQQSQPSQTTTHQIKYHTSQQIDDILTKINETLDTKIHDIDTVLKSSIDVYDDRLNNIENDIKTLKTSRDIDMNMLILNYQKLVCQLCTTMITKRIGIDRDSFQTMEKINDTIANTSDED